MQLTGVQIVQQNIVTNVCDNSLQQQGVDLCVKDIRSVFSGGGGYVPKEGKTSIPTTIAVPVQYKDNKPTYVLSPGYYEVEFNEGCNVPRNTTLHIKTRSSLVRCGAQCYSGQFDGGFNTDHMGCFLHVILPICIEGGARIAQAIVFESNPVDDEHLYNGQWQGDKQRNK